MSSPQLSTTKAISKLAAGRFETLAQFLDEVAALILALPGVHAFELDIAEPFDRLIAGPLRWALGASRKKAVGAISAPIVLAESNGSKDSHWGQLRIQFDLARLDIESPIRFARFAAQQIALVLARTDAERRNQALRVQVDSLAADLDTRKFVQRAAGVLAQQRGVPESHAAAMLRRHSVQTGRDLRQVAEAVIAAYSRGFENPRQRTA